MRTKRMYRYFHESWEGPRVQLWAEPYGPVIVLDYTPGRLRPRNECTGQTITTTTSPIGGFPRKVTARSKAGTHIPAREPVQPANHDSLLLPKTLARHTTHTHIP